MQTINDTFKKFLPNIIRLTVYIISTILAVSVGVWLAVSFSEPESGTVGFTEPTNMNASGTAITLIGTSNSTNQGTGTLFDYMRQIDDSPSAYAEPSPGASGTILALIGDPNPTTADGSTLFNYLKRLDDNVNWGINFAYGDDDPDYVLGTASSSGLALMNTWNGSAVSPVADYANYTYALGGVDDYNNGGSTGDGYGTSTPWTQCTSGNSYCGSNESTVCSGDVCWLDDSTGLIWSDYLDSGTNHTWHWANNCYNPGTGENPGSCSSNGDDACQCVKKTSSKTGCEALGDGNWRLPYRKELMQVYVNLAKAYLSNTNNNFWTTVTRGTDTSLAWPMHLETGEMVPISKTSSIDTRCVR